MNVLKNPHRGRGLPQSGDGYAVLPSVDAGRVTDLLSRCPTAAETPLLSISGLASSAGVATLHIKDERERMGLGSFKALGAAYVIASDADDAGEAGISDRVYVAASAGNHGLSVAAGARIFGATAVIYLAQTVSASFAARLEAKGARVVRAGETYEESMAAAARAADENGWTLLSDSSWPGYFDIPRRVKEGYLQMSTEIISVTDEPPTHVLLQAGVGGMAASVAAHLRQAWGDGPTIVVVEPEAAPALMESVRAGKAVTTEGPVSVMGRLDCKEPSLIALAGLARDADHFVTITEDEAEQAVAALSREGLETTPSGAAGLAALLSAGTHHEGLGIGANSRVLTIVTERSDA